MSYIDYSRSVSDAMEMLRAKGFNTNAWTQECEGTVNNKWVCITFYPSADDDKFILLMKEGQPAKYISKAELFAILNSNN